MDLPSVPPPGELFIGRAQLAAKLGVHPRTIDRLRADGLLPRPGAPPPTVLVPQRRGPLDDGPDGSPRLLTAAGPAGS
jgi:hypothetical protein